MKLSILICSIKSRSHLLARLMAILDMQEHSDVEVLVSTDNREKKISDKRNELLDKAKGDYIVFIDDDDLVPSYYIAELLQAIESKPDCVGFDGYMTTNGKDRYNFKISNTFDSWYEKDRVYYRTINHLCPVKRELALQVKFPRGINSGEDSEYSNRLRPLLKREVYINKDMYHYDYQTAISTQGK
jgi:glycosyltransferase involved in cell wall biosynthesis